MANVVIRGEERLIRRLTRLARGISSRQILDQIGAYLTTSIKTRVQARHEGADGQPLEPYTPKYRLWRTKMGYGTAVDLTLTGSMFNSLDHKTYAEEVRIFFMPGSGKSLRGKSIPNAAKAFYLQENRNFFGYTHQDVATILQLYRVNIGELLRGNQQ